MTLASANGRLDDRLIELNQELGFRSKKLDFHPIQGIIGMPYPSPLCGTEKVRLKSVEGQYMGTKWKGSQTKGSSSIRTWPKMAKCMGIGTYFSSAQTALLDAALELRGRKGTEPTRALNNATIELGIAIRGLERLRELNGSVWKEASPIHRKLIGAERRLRAGEVTKGDLNSVRDLLSQAIHRFDRLGVAAARHCRMPSSILFE